MFLFIITVIVLSQNPLLPTFVEGDGRNDAIIPYLEDDTLGLNINDLDEDDEELLPPCDLNNPDPKLVEWRLLSNSHDVFLDSENVSILHVIIKYSINIFFLFSQFT